MPCPCRKTPATTSSPSRGVVNHPVCYEIARQSLLKALGEEHTTTLPASMGAESFAILAAYYPSYYGAVGGGACRQGWHRCQNLL